MVYNILNGDALAYSFPDAKIKGDMIVCREALIDGDLSGNTLQDFWHSRAEYIEVTETDYHEKVVSEFEKIMHAPGDSEFNLWFEYDLFCQVNMWFVISFINNLSVKKKVYAVYTSYLDRNNKHFWNGFGPANASQLQICFADRILLSNTDIQLGQELWAAYKDNNFEELIHLANSQSFAFPYLQEVVKAHVDRFPKDGTKGRPEKVIEDITKNISTDFNKVFEEFWKRESIYGFGDTQLKHLFDKVIMQENKFIGEWILQPERSEYDVGNPPLSATYTFQAIEGDKLAVKIDWKNFDESEQSVSYVINPDGCMYEYDGGDIADMVKAEFKSQNILETSVFKKGRLMAFASREIIDQNEMKVVQTSYTLDGNKFDKVQFYKRNILAG